MFNKKERIEVSPVTLDGEPVGTVAYITQNGFNIARVQGCCAFETDKQLREAALENANYLCELHNDKLRERPTGLVRGKHDWCDNGYHKITKQLYQGVWFYFGHIGSMTGLLDEDLNPHSNHAYHKIDLVKGEAYTGSQEYSFTEHLNFKHSKNNGVNK